MHADELRGDLDQASEALRRARAEVVELEKRVASLEALLDLVDEPVIEPAGPSGLTLHDAMVEVLKNNAVGMMRAGDLAAEINRQRLYRMRDGRPVEPQQIHARVGHYPQLFDKEGTYIKLRTT
jgi:hypothetical protein